MGLFSINPIEKSDINKSLSDCNDKPLQQCLCDRTLKIDYYKNDNKAVHFYTGLESYRKFKFLYSTLGPAVDRLNYIYGPPPKDVTPINRFFLTLIILRQHKTHYEMSLLFNISEKQVSNIFFTWIRFMKLQWSEISQWPERELVRFFSPHDFKKKYPRVRIIVDGTEIPVQKPSNPTAQKSTFSKYKNKNTVKLVVGATPGGLISYLSPTYGGSVTDRQIIERSDLLKMLDLGDSVMADKGFDVEDILAAYKVTLNIPTFFKKKNQITPHTLREDKKIASKRVHIERLIGLGKTYKILEGPLFGIEITLAEDISFICFNLCNFRKCIVDKLA